MSNMLEHPLYGRVVVTIMGKQIGTAEWIDSGEPFMCQLYEFEPSNECRDILPSTYCLELDLARGYCVLVNDDGVATSEAIPLCRLWEPSKQQELPIL